MTSKFLLPLSGVLLLLFSSCGKKGPPSPPPMSQQVQSVGGVKGTSNSRSAIALVKGEGGYFVGDGGIVALYWSFPLKVDYSQILLGDKRIATVEGSTYIYPRPLEGGKRYTFRVVGIRGNRPVAEVVIEVTP